MPDPKDPASSAPADILGGDYKRQIKVLRDYLLTIAQHPPQAVQAAPAKSEDKATTVKETAAVPSSK